MQKIAVVGGGASGFFVAINIAEKHKNTEITIFEKTIKVLTKVAISGGGRCNFTHHCYEPKKLATFYPRGEKFLKALFYEFSPKNTQDWFEKRGVKSKIEADGRIFPQSDNSQTVIACFQSFCKKYQIGIEPSTFVEKIEQEGSGFLVYYKNNRTYFDKVVIATGGLSKIENFDFLSDFNLKIEKPLPSLFTFNIPNNPIKNLQGISNEVIIKIKNSNLIETGSMLITHWGFSGPAILRLSAWGAKQLAEKNYHFFVEINWWKKNDESLRNTIQELKTKKATTLIQNTNFTEMPKRLWSFLLEKAHINPQRKWADLTKEEMKNLQKILLEDVYEVKGKTTFKEEFVTCGGINLDEINPKTMASKRFPNLYFTGEVLDIDGITGGFNFQAAWTTAWIASELL
ncbi:MAG: NAD(P)/FAD-dependent oxidoreductase [Thermonemataceae bacterium]|nr:NAD(P)/FAD-dependent oxidoreductase [Thermonemataceae bacterium]